MTLPRLGMAVAAALALTFTGGAASAQQKAKAPSPCAGLAETVCKGNSACSWYRETTTKKGQKRKAHCQKKPTRSPAKSKTPGKSTK